MSRPPLFDDDELLPEQLVLSDLITRVLDKGVVIHSNILISLADIDLIQIDLRMLISSVATLQQRLDRARGADAAVRTDARE